MNTALRYITLICFLVMSALQVSHATHNRSGEITYRQIGPLTIEMTVTTYTKASSGAADRDSLLIDWGDGTFQFVKRTNGIGDLLANDVKRNFYIAQHTYPGRSTYTIGFQDPNRVNNILNVNPPNSIDIKFFISTTFTLLDLQFQGPNSSAILLQPPLDIACVGQTFVHNPNAYDPDGDSLSYELIVPLESPGSPVPNYFYPNEIVPGLGNTISLNPLTGEFIWDSPPVQGEFNIAILVKEWRNGVLINEIIRDMQILVKACNNEPPTIDVIDEICVTAGDTIDLSILIDDPDEGQQVIFSALGGPLFIDNDSAQIIGPNDYLDPQFESRFFWATTCNHISEQYYQVVLKAEDNFFNDRNGLATLKTIRIKVIGPEPKNLEAEVENDDITLTWDFPYQCQNTDNNYFQGFSVWRANSTISPTLDTCFNGIPPGYEKVEFITRANDGIKYFWIDEDLDRNQTYCYRVLAEFALSNSNGNPYNRVESRPSREVCADIARDIPFITNVSVETTGQSGDMLIKWVNPRVTDIDLVANPGPYRLQLTQSILGDANYLPISGGSFTATELSDLTTTEFIHRGINTENIQHDYVIQFYTNGTFLYGESQPASSIFLNINSTDRTNELSWTYRAPWSNTTYNIYREDDDGNYILLGTTEGLEFKDLGIENGKEYCYFIEAIGSYGVPDLPSPLINYSQIKCSTPNDNVAPCSPLIEVRTVCDESQSFNIDNLFNTITWQDANLSCELSEEAASYNIYLQVEDGDDILLSNISVSSLNEFQHIVTEETLLGCYYVTSIDDIGNESEPSKVICVENCPLYELPNTFTPNADGANDLFKPLKQLFIESIDLKVYNEWGNLVFETTDPSINWDGKDHAGKDLPNGSYYYLCRVFVFNGESSLELKPILRGHINIFR